MMSSDQSVSSVPEEISSTVSNSTLTTLTSPSFDDSLIKDTTSQSSTHSQLHSTGGTTTSDKQQSLFDSIYSQPYSSDFNTESIDVSGEDQRLANDYSTDFEDTAAQTSNSATNKATGSRDETDPVIINSPQSKSFSGSQTGSCGDDFLQETVSSHTSANRSAYTDDFTQESNGANSQSIYSYSDDFSDKSDRDDNSSRSYISEYTPSEDSMKFSKDSSAPSSDGLSIEFADRMMNLMKNSAKVGPISAKRQQPAFCQPEAPLPPSVTRYTQHVIKTLNDRQASRPEVVVSPTIPEAGLPFDHYISRRVELLRVDNISQSLSQKSQQLDKEIAEHRDNTKRYKSEELSREFALRNKVLLSREIFNDKYDNHVNKMNTVSMIGELASELPLPTSNSDYIWNRLLDNRTKILANQMQDKADDQSDTG